MGNGKNMTFILIAAVVVIAAVLVFAWQFLFGRANSQLPTAQVTVASSTSSGFLPSSSTAASSSGDADSTDVDIPNPTLPEEQLSIDRGTWTVELATTMVEQARGLSYRASLGADDGMLFVFSSPGVQSFWMKDMNFPLDMIWISSDGTVAGFAQNVPAPAPGTAVWSLPTYQSPAGVNEVLEVNAGTVAQYGIKVGDKVTVSQ